MSYHRSHSSKSLSQPTIPEEGPEHSADWDPATSSADTYTRSSHSLTNKILPGFTNKDSQQPQQDGKSETKACKSLTAELGARPKEVKSKHDEKNSHPTFTSYVSDRYTKLSCDTNDKKSPKLGRTERTVQKISKVIRGTTRSDSRSKKSRETSLSPSTQDPVSGGKENKSQSQEKKSAQKKRDFF